MVLIVRRWSLDIFLEDTLPGETTEISESDIEFNDTSSCFSAHKLMDMECPQSLKADRQAHKKECIFAYKRNAANIAWPKSV